MVINPVGKFRFEGEGLGPNNVRRDVEEVEKWNRKIKYEQEQAQRLKLWWIKHTQINGVLVTSPQIALYFIQYINEIQLTLLDQTLSSLKFSPLMEVTYLI